MRRQGRHGHHVVDRAALGHGEEPLDQGLVLVPPVYDVLLHAEAYQALRSLIPRIKGQAKQRLDAELDKLNHPRKGGVRRWFRRLRYHLARLFFAERYLEQGRDVHATFERAGDAWHIDIGVTSEPDAEVHYLAVETSFDAQSDVALKGRPTVNIRRRTVVLPNGRFETILTAARPTPAAGGSVARQGARPTRRPRVGST